MYGLVTTKIFIAVGTFFISFTSAAAPLRVIRIDDHLFSIGNMVAAGVLLAGGLVHQLPDSSESLEDKFGDYPLASFIAGLTFTFFLLLEEYLHLQMKDNELFAQIHGPRSISDSEQANQQRPHERSSLISHDTPGNSGCCIIASENDCAAYLTSSTRSDAERNEECRTIPKKKIDIHHRRSTSGTNSVLDSMRDYSFSYQHPVHYHESHLVNHAKGSLLSSVLLLTALSFHSLFEALAIGVATDTASITSTTSAVLAHKAFAGYALGSAMVASHMRELHVLVLSFVFGLCSIAGVFLGIFLLPAIDADNSVTVIGIIQAMVSGTFLYVSIVEIAMKELMTHREGKSDLPIQTWQIRKLLGFLVGYLMMSVLAIWV